MITYYYCGISRYLLTWNTWVKTANGQYDNHEIGRTDDFLKMIDGHIVSQIKVHSGNRN